MQGDRRIIRDPDETTLSSGPVFLDLVNQTVWWKGKPIDLTSAEFGIVETLLRKPGRAFSRRELISDDSETMERTVDVQIASIRNKFGKWGDHFETVREIGYRFRQGR